MKGGAWNIIGVKLPHTHPTSSPTARSDISRQLSIVLSELSDCPSRSTISNSDRPSINSIAM